VPTIKRARPPIWIPGKNFPDDPWALFDIMKPMLRDGELVWLHTPATFAPTWRDKLSSCAQDTKCLSGKILNRTNRL
jgi:hypothetical protein